MNLESKNLEQLLAEADELIQQINSDFIKDMKEGIACSLKNTLKT